MTCNVGPFIFHNATGELEYKETSFQKCLLSDSTCFTYYTEYTDGTIESGIDPSSIGEMVASNNNVFIFVFGHVTKNVMF